MVILSAIIFGCMPLMTGIIRRDGVNSLSIVLLRNLISLPTLAVLALIQHKSLRVPVRFLPSMAGAALMGCCLTPILLYTSYVYIDASTATVFHFIYPAAVVLGSVVFFKEKLSRGMLVSVLLCVAGVCLFYNPAKPLNVMGAGFALLSGMTYATYVLLLSAFSNKSIGGFLYSFYVSLVCSLVMLVICLSTNQLTLPCSWQGWAMSVFFATVVNVGAVVLFQKGTFLIGGQRASILSTMEPLTSIVVDACSGVLITLQSVFGSLLVIAATVLISVFDSKKKEK